MWRAFFLAIGITCCILGAESLILEKAVLASKPVPQVNTNTFFSSSPIEPPREIKPPEWAPWSLLSVGVVVILYSLTIRRS